MKKTERRVAQAEAQNWRCAHCGGVMQYDGHHQDGATIEHVIPLSQGGLRVRGNEVSAHRRCNEARGSRPLDPTSRAIAFELMGFNYEAQRRAAVNGALQSFEAAAHDLQKARGDLLRYIGDPTVEEVRRRLAVAAKAVLRAGSGDVPFDGAATLPPPVPPRPKIGERLDALCRSARFLVERAAARLRVITHAVRAAADIEAPAGDVEVRIVVTAKGTADELRADWQKRYGVALTAHNNARPLHHQRAQWRAAFLTANPDARVHPGCPPL